MTLQEFWQSTLGRQIAAFARTYITLFLAMYLQQVTIGAQQGQDFVLFNWLIIVPAAKWSLLAVLNNIYQLLEKPVGRAVGGIFKRKVNK